MRTKKEIQDEMLALVAEYDPRKLSGSDAVKVGKLIREMRFSLGMSMGNFARQVGMCSTQTAMRWERGVLPRAPAFYRIARFVESSEVDQSQISPTMDQVVLRIASLLREFPGEKRESMVKVALTLSGLEI